ncbi:MAG: CopD family protein [Ignavibacteriales bacterium]|nr:CopD family protein [Ignavibacteriales bacterium]
MDFVLWACRLMHVVSVVVWFGGLIFLNAVFIPIVEHHEATKLQVVLGTQKRFLPFIWSCFWSLLITGILLMLLSPKFLWFEYSTLWLKLLAVKQFAFLLLAFFSWQTVQVFSNMEHALANDSDEFEGWRLGLKKLVRRSIFWGIVALMCGAGMAVS